MSDLKKSKLKKKLDKNKLSKKQRILIIKIILICFLLIIMLGLILIINKAKILRVEIRGLERLNAIDIIENANLSKYNNIILFNVPKENIKKEIENNPRIEVKNIKTSFPDLLIVNVKERETLFLLETARGIYQITDNGYIIKNEAVYNYDVPYITGLNINLTNKTVENDDYAKYLTSLIYELKTTHNEIYNLISEINASGNDLILYPRGYKVQIILSKYVKADKFIALAAVLKTIKNEANAAHTIDFRFEEAIVN